MESVSVTRKHDPAGFPDFTYPVTMKAMTIESLAVDIKAQTIPALKVDISAQSLSTLSVNIVACAATLNVNILSQSVTVNVKTAVGEHVDTDIVSSVTLPINIVAQTITTLAVDIKAQTVGNLNVNIAASAVTLDVAIQSTAVTLPVSIQSSAVTFNVNIVSQAVDINIKTSSGANIVIDKLTQGAYIERRSVLENNGETPIMVDGNKTYARGKFFPRGCRGFISNVQVYCDNLDAVQHVLTVHFTVAPGMGDVYAVTLPLPAGSSEDWRLAYVKRMWNYDSLFIWVESDSDAYGRIGVDLGAPFDAYGSTDRAEWMAGPARLWIKVMLTGETVGDLPVTGTLNTVRVPNASSCAAGELTAISKGVEAVLLTLHGAGIVDAVRFATTHPAVELRIYVDDVYVQKIVPEDLYNWGFTASTPAYSLLKYSATATNYALITIPYEFKRKFELRGWHNLDTLQGILAYVNYRRIS